MIKPLALSAQSPAWRKAPHKLADGLVGSERGPESRGGVGRGSPRSPAARPPGRRPLRGDGCGLRLPAPPPALAASRAAPPLGARHGTGAGLGQGRPGGAGGAGPPRPAPPPRRPPLSPPRAAGAQNGGSSGRGHSSGSGSGSSCARAPLGPARPGPAPQPRRRACRGASGAPAARLTLKFLAVLLAAGMLAFLGAVICIIASVPLAASPARALPGGADNASAAAASPGPQRSLSALHGAGGSAGPPALPGAPAASAHPLPPVPLFSRFLCTPLAAACPSGAEPGDAAPGEREELLLLQSTAEQLRQTALQQEARIRADQDTIRELTGKLGRCESGLPRGLQEAGPRRDTMADGPWDSPALILELEDAVRALRDRIDRIEVSAAPRAVGDPAGGGRDRPRESRASPVPRPPPAQGPWGRGAAVESLNLGFPSVQRGWLDLPPRGEGRSQVGPETHTAAQGARGKSSLPILFPPGASVSLSF